MATNIKATRLGDILVEKGLINDSQLKRAIAEQKRLRADIDPNDKAAMEVTSIGEVLIGLGYINHQQLKRGLGWQMSLRRMTFAMALFAPLMSLGTGAAAQVAPTSSSSKTASTLPLTVQAEDYSTMLGIQTEPTADVGGGLNVGYFHPGDWLSYSNNSFLAAQSGNYKVTYRVATNGAGASFALHEADKSVQYDVVELPNTGGFQKWVDVERTINLSAGTHSLGITTLARGAGFNFNWFKVEYKGLALPITIQAEDYTSMSGIQTEPTSDAGGGLNVGYFHEKDWLSYSDKTIDIPKTGAYKITIRAASMEGGGSLSFHEADGSANYATFNVPKTGGQQNWINVEQTVQLTAGSHKFGFTALARGAKGFNLNWFKIEPVDSAGTVSSSSSSSQSSQAGTIQGSSSSSAVVMPSSSSSSSAAATTSSSGVVSSAASSINDVTKGEAYFKWTAPTARANGDLLTPEDLGGYEIRYRLVGESKYKYVSSGIGPWDNSYVLTGLTSGTYIFEIAAFDKNGIYSQFVALKAL